MRPMPSPVVLIGSGSARDRTGPSGDSQQLRAQAERLRGQADAALTPQPVADRLRARAAALAELADKHDRTESHSPTRNRYDDRP
jgi:hypothetical protein